MYKCPHSCCQTQTDTHLLSFLLFLSALCLPNSFPCMLPPPSSSSAIVAWRRVVKFMTFRSRGAGWWRTRIVSRVPAGICLSLMSELYNVSTPDNLALGIFGSERESHLLHLVTEQWLPLQCLLLLDNLITALTSTVCTTWNGIMGSVKDKGRSNLNALFVLSPTPALFSVCSETHHKQYTPLLERKSLSS